ncbi:MAG TPA: hypothetical protein VJZ00_09270, partial [Thermoanaerobaculia bacterium]|nr:hypothetical protein [Thermoanaerobaculia bacterium]
MAVIAFVLAGASALAGEDDHLALVPWKVLAGEERVDAPLTLFWIPASSDELRRSELLTSADLTLFSARCVAMRVVRFDDGARLARLKIGEELPVAVLVDRDSRLLGRVESVDGVLPLTKIEELVRDELNAREGLAEAALDEARRRADSGELDAALAIYNSLWEQRCVCPRQGKDARRAMK